MLNRSSLTVLYFRIISPVLAMVLLTSCFDQLDKKTQKNSSSEYNYPFAQYKRKRNPNCLAGSFHHYPQGLKIGGIKICHKKGTPQNELYFRFQKSSPYPLCLIPMHLYTDNTQESIGNPLCIEQKKGQTIRVRLKNNKKGVNLSGKSFSSLPLNALMIVRDSQGALKNLQCCFNASHYQQAGTGVPFPNCTLEYKRRICNEFLKKYKGNYIHNLNFLKKD